MKLRHSLIILPFAAIAVTEIAVFGNLTMAAIAVLLIVGCLVGLSQQTPR
jgi:hypothetical protein